jgi:hypothetical protein
MPVAQATTDGHDLGASRCHDRLELAIGIAARRLGDNLVGSAAVKPRDDLVGNVVLRTDLPQNGAE